MNVAGEASTAEILAGLDIAAAQAALLRRRLAVEAALTARGTSATRFRPVHTMPPRPRG